MGKTEHEKDFEEVDVTEIIERLEKLEKEVISLEKRIGKERFDVTEYMEKVRELESSLETVIESLDDSEE